MKSLFLILSIMGMTGFAALDQTIYQFTVTDINGDEVNLGTYSNKVVLIVNVASECGLTPQYEELQKLYEDKKDQGLVILGFPANNFAGQEPGTEEEIMAFCEKNYGVTFPMFSKISVKGDDIHPLYQFLTAEALNGHADAPVSWNFQKFLIGKDGKVRDVFSPRTSVLDAKSLAVIEALLAE